MFQLTVPIAIDPDQPAPKANGVCIMTRSSMMTFAAACAAALALAGVAAAPANASYLGYGNGDPGNWDFFTEQNGGRAPSPPAHLHAAQMPSAHGAPVYHHHHSAAPKSDNVKHY